jgi:hypothetical protein
MINVSTSPRLHVSLLLLLVAIFSPTSFLQGQPKNSQVKDAVMASPTAAAMGKYGDIPVSYYTGVPNISVPIYNLQEGSLSHDISLSYHNSGIKVAETPSWVGANWNLNAGGAITRTILGLPDEKTSGYFMNGDKILNPDVPELNTGINSSQKDIVNYGELDAEPDLFSFSVGQYSGKFYLMPKNAVGSSLANRAIWVPKSDFKFLEEPKIGDLSVEEAGIYVQGVFKSFALVDPMGNIYRFGQTGEVVSNIHILKRMLQIQSPILED